jgi:transposase
MVENAFRACKTGQLESRPIDVRKEGRTRSHVFVVMLSYLLLRQLRKSRGELDMTVEEGLKSTGNSLHNPRSTNRNPFQEPDHRQPCSQTARRLPTNFSTRRHSLP